MILGIDGVGQSRHPDYCTNVICTDLLYSYMKGRIDKFDKELEKRLDNKNFFDDVGADSYIDNTDDANEASHMDGDNTPCDEKYGDTISKDFPEKGDIDNAASDNYVGAEVIMDVPGEDPRRENVRHCVEDLDRAKVGMYHWNLLMDT